MKRLKLKSAILTLPDGKQIVMNDLTLNRNGSTGCYRLDVPDSLVPVHTAPTVDTFSGMPESTHFLRLTRIFGDVEWLKFNLLNDGLMEVYSIDADQMKILRAYLSSNDYILFNKFKGACWKKGKRWPKEVQP